MGTGDDIDPTPEGLGDPRLVAFRVFLGLHLTAWSVLWLGREHDAPALWFRVAVVVAVAVWAAATVRGRSRGWLDGVALAAVAGLAAAVFPATSNHGFLGAVCLGWLVLVRPTEALPALRWTVVIVAFYAGVQKVLHGTYFDGTFLAYQVAHSERFTATLGALLPTAELARLQALEPLTVGAGPYRLTSWVGLTLSNAVWIAELVLPPLLWIRRTRTAAMVGLIAVVLAIEIAAREVLFGGLFVALLLLFGPPTWLRRALPWLGVVYVVYVIWRLSGGPA